MGVSKVEFDGEPVIDITDSTVTPDTMEDGIRAYNAAGDPVIGSMKVKGLYIGADEPTDPKVSLWIDPEDESPAVLPIAEGGTGARTPEQARENLGVPSKDEVSFVHKAFAISGYLASNGRYVETIPDTKISGYRIVSIVPSLTTPDAGLSCLSQVYQDDQQILCIVRNESAGMLHWSFVIEVHYVKI